jgi:nucleotide-binding universal stress UspA family protein
MPDRIAYLPLNTYPEAAPDPAVLAAVQFANGLGCGLQATTFAVDIPPVVSPMGGFVIGVEGLARAAEDQSRAECARLRGVVEQAASAELGAAVTSRRDMFGSGYHAAVTEARHFDMALLPWSADALWMQDMAQALVFGSGVPVILVPAATPAEPLEHVAIGWDESRVAARALSDALHLLPAGGRVSVLTVQGDKVLGGSGIAQTMAASLQARGYDAKAVDVALSGRTIAKALQDAAMTEGAQLLAIGGFGHSRLRDFILGGATKGVLADLQLPVLLAH